MSPPKSGSHTPSLALQIILAGYYCLCDVALIWQVSPVHGKRCAHATMH